MAKAAKIPAANGNTSSPKKGACELTQKYKPSPQKTSLKEGKKSKIVNLKHPDGTCYGWVFFISTMPRKSSRASLTEMAWPLILKALNSSHSPI
jgi:hypothetical protein